MNNSKVFIVVAAAALVAGCGHKQEPTAALPPEQVLTGNAILAPQQSTLEVKNMALVPVGTTMVVPASQNGVAVPTGEPTLELSSATVSDKPTDKDIQEALKNAGIYQGPVDGNIGTKSKKAIRVFQERNGLTPDGKVGPRTWKKLSSYLHSAPAAEATPVGLSN